MKLLFVENHQVFAETVVAQFLADCDVTIAASVAEAEAELAARSYDAVLVDYDLDDEKGDALVRRMREVSPWPPVIGVSDELLEERSDPPERSVGIRARVAETAALVPGGATELLEPVRRSAGATVALVVATARM